MGQTVNRDTDFVDNKIRTMHGQNMERVLLIICKNLVAQYMHTMHNRKRIERRTLTKCLITQPPDPMQAFVSTTKWRNPQQDGCIIITHAADEANQKDWGYILQGWFQACAQTMRDGVGVTPPLTGWALA